MNIRLTDHALRRYIERVKPGIGPHQARLELRSLLDAGEFQAEVAWSGRSDDRWREEVKPGEDTAFVVISDGIAVPLIRKPNGWVATTVITRGSKSPERKRRRKRDRQRRAYKRNMARLNGQTRDENFYRKVFGKHYAE